MTKANTKEKIILFDGECNLCNGAVDFLIQNDYKRIFRYASLQSDVGKELANKLNLPSKIDSIILVFDNNWYIKADAVIQIIKELKWYWRIFLFVEILPKSLRDKIYDWIADNRYNWFGKRDTCRIPSEEEKELFLE